MVDTGENAPAAPRPAAQLIPPVHLDPDVLAYLADRAKARGVSLSGLVNDLLKKTSP